MSTAVAGKLRLLDSCLSLSQAGLLECCSCWTLQLLHHLDPSGTHIRALASSVATSRQRGKNLASTLQGWLVQGGSNACTAHRKPLRQLTQDSPHVTSLTTNPLRM